VPIRCQQRSFSDSGSGHASEPPPSPPRRQSATPDDAGKMLQQLRVSLEKLPAKKLPQLLAGGKRCKADDRDQPVKKLRLDADPKDALESQVTRSSHNQVPML
jgi:hypothetical protein